jgi:hypothetical protein
MVGKKQTNFSSAPPSVISVEINTYLPSIFRSCTAGTLISKGNLLYLSTFLSPENVLHNFLCSCKYWFHTVTPCQQNTCSCEISQELLHLTWQAKNDWFPESMLCFNSA